MGIKDFRMGAINGTGDDDPSIEPKSQLLFFCFILPLSLFVLLSYGSWIYNYKKKLLMQSVPITANVVSSNPIHGEVYSIQHYVIKVVSDLQQVCGFLQQ